MQFKPMTIWLALVLLSSSVQANSCLQVPSDVEQNALIHSLFLNTSSEEIQRKIEADILFAEAQTAKNNGDVKCAIQKWQKAAAIYQKIDDKLNEADCYLKLAPIYFSRGDLDSAFNYYLHSFSAASQSYESLIVKDIHYDQAQIAQGNTLYEAGRTLFAQKQYTEAIEKLHQARAIYKKIDYGIGQMRAIVAELEVYAAQKKYFPGLMLAFQGLAVASALPIGTPTTEKYMEGLDQYKAGQLQQALATWQAVLPLYEKEQKSTNVAITRSNLGNIYALLGQHNKALHQYALALPTFLQEQDQKNQASTLHNQGITYTQLGDYERAQPALEQALVLWQALGELKYIVATWNGLGLLAREKGEMDAALNLFQKSLALSQRLNDEAGIADSYNNIGYVYYTQAQYKLALDNFKRTLHIWEKLGNALKIANTLSNFATVYTAMGQYSLALEHYQTVLKIQEKMSAEMQSQLFQALQAVTKLNMANIERLLGNYASALDLYKKVLKTFQQINNPLNEGITLSNIGAVYIVLGNLEQAKKYLELARQQFKTIQNREREAYTLNNLGLLTLREDNAEKKSLALDYLQQALVISREIGDQLQIGQQLTNMGFLHATLGHYQDAYENFQESTLIFKNIGVDDAVWRAQVGLALSEFLTKKYQSAESHYEQALTHIENLRTALEDEHNLLFVRDKLLVYDSYIILLTLLHNAFPTKNYAAKTLDIFERKQSRIFLQQMGESGAQQYGGVPEAIPQQEIALNNGLAQTRQRLAEIRAQPITRQNQALIQNLEQENQQLLTKQTALQTQIRHEYPDYYALRYPQPVNLKELQEQVLQPNEVVLVYNVIEKNEFIPQDDMFFGETTLLWLVSKQHFQFFNLGIKPTELEQRVNALHRVLSKQGQRVLLQRGRVLRLLGSEVDWEVAAHMLYQRLIPESVRSLLKDKTLYVVPSGALYRLPFSALVTENKDKPRYLVEDTAINYLSSTSLLKIIREARARRRAEPIYPLLAFANPLYGETNTVLESSNSRTAALYRQFGGLQPLPETEAEARTIAQLLNAPTQSNLGIKTLQLKGDATRSRLLSFNAQQHLNDYRYFLFAMHGILNKVKKPIQPALALSYPQQDGYLTMADIFGLKLNADFIMLSACNTGSGDPSGAGEGIRGLTGAFMYAGTPAVAVTLWAVETHSAKALSTEIFRQLHAGLPTAKAIQTAKLKMLRGALRGENGESWQHSFFWAPFVGFGDGGVAHTHKIQSN